jgi:hypothetical protein
MTARERKAKRSAAAKKGWETRTARERREIEQRQSPYGLAVQEVARGLKWPDPFTATIIPAAPDPAPGILKALWLKATGWLR